MSYSIEDFERECAEWEAKHGKKIYLKQFPLPNWMKGGKDEYNKEI